MVVFSLLSVVEEIFEIGTELVKIIIGVAYKISFLDPEESFDVENVVNVQDYQVEPQDLSDVLIKKIVNEVVTNFSLVEIQVHLRIHNSNSNVLVFLILIPLLVFVDLDVTLGIVGNSFVDDADDKLL